MGNKIIQGNLNVLGTISQNGSALPTISGVMEFESKSAFPETGQTGVIYVDKSENVLYRWDSTASDYVGLAVAENGIEIVNYNEYTANNSLSDEQIAKAMTGMLLVSDGGNIFYPYSMNNSYVVYVYIYESTYTIDDTYCYQTYNDRGTLKLDVTNKKLRNKGYGNDIKAIAYKAENFFSSSDLPTQTGKKLVREQNIYGKILPNYTSSDANKIVKINSTGTGVELDNLETATELDVNRLFRTEYPITTNITNGTTSGATSIWTKETAFVEIHPNEEYGMPQSVTVTGATYNYSGTGVTLSAVTGNVTITGECGSLTPVHKGDIIKFDALGDGNQRRFRVLSCDENSIAKLLDFTQVPQVEYGPNGTGFDTINSLELFENNVYYKKYKDSAADNFLNTEYYNSLAAGIRAAIITTEIKQTSFSYAMSGTMTDPDFKIVTPAGMYGECGYKKLSEVLVGNRNIYAIDMQEIIDYFNKTDITSVEYRTLFNFGTQNNLPSMWLRSAGIRMNSYESDKYYALSGGQWSGMINDVNYDNKYPRFNAVFKIDLSKIVYTVEE